VLDPQVQPEGPPYANARVMKAGPDHTVRPVHFPGVHPAGARYEWCINSAVVDPPPTTQ